MEKIGVPSLKQYKIKFSRYSEFYSPTEDPDAMRCSQEPPDFERQDICHNDSVKDHLRFFEFTFLPAPTFGLPLALPLSPDNRFGR